MTDRDSINLEQLYAHSNARRQIREEWDTMSTQIIMKHGDQLVAEGVLEEGVWDSIKSGASKVAGAVGGAVGAAKDAVSQKLMAPVIKMLSQKFPDSFGKVVAAVQQGKSFEQIAKEDTGTQPVASQEGTITSGDAVLEELYYSTRICNEDITNQYSLDDWWAEACRVEDIGKLENAWSLFDEMVNEGPEANVAGASAPTPTGQGGRMTQVKGGEERLQGTYSDRFTGNMRNDTAALKQAVKEFLAAHPNYQRDGRFAQIEKMISNLDREGRAKDGGAPAGTPTGGDAPGTDVAVNIPDPATDAGAPGGETPAPGGMTIGGGDGGDAGADTPGEPAAPEAKSGGMLAKTWNWIKQNPGKAATVGGLAALLLFVGLTPVTFLGLLRGLGTGIAQGAAMADPDVVGQTIDTTLAPGAV